MLIVGGGSRRIRGGIGGKASRRGRRSYQDGVGLGVLWWERSPGREYVPIEKAELMLGLLRFGLLLFDEVDQAQRGAVEGKLRFRLIADHTQCFSGNFLAHLHTPLVKGIDPPDD